MANHKIKGLGRSKPERGTRKARTMWRVVYMRHGWYNFTWPGWAMRKAEQAGEA